MARSRWGIKKLSPELRVRLLVDHHITNVRFGESGEVLALEHCTFGEISPGDLYWLDHAHQGLRDLLPKIIEGGYRFKEAIWTTYLPDVEVLGSGVKVPMGVAFLVGAGILAIADWARAEALLVEAETAEAKARGIAAGADKTLPEDPEVPRLRAHAQDLRGEALRARLEAALDIGSLFLPFGELWLMYRGVGIAKESLDRLVNFVAEVRAHPIQIYQPWNLPGLPRLG